MTVTEEQTTTDIDVGNVIHTEHTAIGTVIAVTDGTAYFVGRRADDDAPWKLITAPVSTLSLLDVPADVQPPGLAEVGQALVAKEAELRTAALNEAAIQAEADAKVEAFKTRVRDRIVANADAYSWDNDEVNELLGELDLPGLTREFRVPVDLTATQTVYIDVDATNEDDAKEQVEQMSDTEIFDRVSSYDWDVSSDWEVDRYNIEEN